MRLQLGDNPQRHELVHEDKEGEREEQAGGHAQPGRARRRVAAAALALPFLQRHVGREAQRADAQLHGLVESSDAAKNRVLVDLVALRHAVDGHFLGDDPAIRLAHRDAITVRGAHHHAFHDGLPADEGFLAALQCGQHLRMHEDAEKSAEGHW